VDLKKLPTANLRHRPGRTVLLIVLVALLAFTAFGGTLVVGSLRNGMASLEARMGADIIVAPKTAASQVDLAKIMVEGVPGSFYMDASYLGKIAEREGVEKVSPQYYLATAKAGCCSFPVQIIGIDPATDFTIQPWIARSYADELGYLDVVAGCNISGSPGDVIRFYGVDCRIVAKLDETGTALDNAVFATAETVQRLIEGSVEQGISVLAENDPADAISTVQVKVENGYNVTNVVDDINLHVRGVKAEPARSMISGVADSIAGASGVVGVLAAVICVLALVVLVVVFLMLGRSRTREFAVLRVIGASRQALSRIVMKEALIVSTVGAIAGIALAAVVVIGFSSALEIALGLPFLLPDAGAIVLTAVGVLAVALVAGAAASAVSASCLSKVDAGSSLREE